MRTPNMHTHAAMARGVAGAGSARATAGTSARTPEARECCIRFVQCEKYLEGGREGGKALVLAPNTLTRTHYICEMNTCRFMAMSHLPRRLCLPAGTRPTRKASCPLYADASARGARPATWKHGGERVGYRRCAGSSGWAWGNGQPRAQMRSPVLCAMYPRVDGCPAYLSRVSRGACLWGCSYMLVTGCG